MRNRVSPSRRSSSARKSRNSSKFWRNTSGAVGDDLLPVLIPGVIDRCLHQPEIPGVEVGPDIEVVAKMIGRVFQAGAPGLDDAKVPSGMSASRIAVFSAQRLAAGDHQVAVGPCPQDPATKGLVRLLVSDRIVDGRRVPRRDGEPDSRGASWDPAWCRTGSGCRWPRPCFGGDVGDRVIEDVAGREVLDADRVKATAAGVDGERELAVVGARLATDPSRNSPVRPRAHFRRAGPPRRPRSSPSCEPGSDTAYPLRTGCNSNSRCRKQGPSYRPA